MNLDHIVPGLLPNPLGNASDLLAERSFGRRISMPNVETNALDALGFTRGSILYRGASAWSILAPGTSGYALCSNGSGADPSYQAVTTAAANLITGYVYGFHLAYVTTTTVTVDSGVCRDKADAATIALSSQVTVTLPASYSDSANAAIQGCDSFQGPGTITTTNASTSVAGTSTTFTTSFGTRAMSGTCSSSATTVTGTGTKFLSEIAIGDLIGNSTKGFALVTAIASDTSLTLNGAPPNAAFASSSVNCIENPTISSSTTTNAQRVMAISSDTALTTAIGQSAGTNVNYKIGIPATTSASTAGVGQNACFVWVGTGSGGTGCYLSTQRTTPYGVTNYNTAIRRIGSLFTVSGTMLYFEQYGIGVERRYQYEVSSAANLSRVLSAGTATAWTGVACSSVVPPTAVAITFSVDLTSSVGNIAYLRRRNSGDTALSRNMWSICVASGGAALQVTCACDGAQAIDYVNGTGALNTYIDVSSYLEML